MLDDKEKIKIELLIKECENVEQDIRNLFNITQSVITITFVIFTTGLAYGISANIKAVLLILPFAFLGILLYGALIFTTMTALGGYKRHLEEKINTVLGENLLLWESFIIKKKNTWSFGYCWNDLPLLLIHNSFLVICIL